MGDDGPIYSEAEAYVVHPTTDSRAVYGDFAAYVSEERFAELGRGYVVVHRRVEDIPATDGWPVRPDLPLRVLCRLRVDDHPVDQRSVRLDQNLRFAVGIPHKVEGDHVWLDAVHPSIRFRARERVASWFGIQMLIGRSAVSWLSASEKGVVEVRAHALSLLGCNHGDRVRFHGLEWSADEQRFEVFSASVPALGIDPDVAARRESLDTKPGSSPLFVDPRAFFGFAEEYGQQEDIPEVWMDADVRHLVNAEVLAPVRLRRSILSGIATEFRTTGLFVALAVVALTQVFGVQGGVVPGVLALVAAFAVALLVIAWGLRQQVAAPTSRRR